MHSGGLRRWCTCASWLQRVADLEELGDVRATHDRCDHCCATVVGVDLDTEGAGGVGAHRHTERRSLVHEEQSVPLRRGVAAHCCRRRPACGVHSRREHESGRHRDGTVSRFRTFVATWPSPSRSDFHARGSRAFLFLLRSELAEVAALAREMRVLSCCRQRRLPSSGGRLAIAAARLPRWRPQGLRWTASLATPRSKEGVASAAAAAWSDAAEERQAEDSRQAERSRSAKSAVQREATDAVMRAFFGGY